MKKCEFRRIELHQIKNFPTQNEVKVVEVGNTLMPPEKIPMYMCDNVDSLGAYCLHLACDQDDCPVIKRDAVFPVVQ